MSDVTAIDAMISIHALREEGDVTASAMSFRTWYFYPRPPRGGRQWGVNIRFTITKFLSTPSARRATIRSYQATLGQQISIHALREEGDRRSPGRTRPSVYFYPRPPRGGRHILRYGHRGLHEFLSTPSARRATRVSVQDFKDGAISIHALREEGDP